MKQWVPIIITSFLISITAQAQSDVVLTDSIYAIADVNPVYPGCGADSLDSKSCSLRELYRMIFSQLKYPKYAREKQITGTTVSSFVIDKSGRVQDIKIIKEPGGGLGEEVLRILKIMQTEVTWEPALKADQKINFRYVLPIKFKLDNLNNDTYEDKYLVFKAWGGKEVFRGMVTKDIQDAIPEAIIKNIETYNYQKSKAVYNVLGNAHLVHFRNYKLARPQELKDFKSSELWELGLENIKARYIPKLDQLNITIPKVKKSMRYYIYNYVGDIIHEGRLKKSNGTIEKIDISKATKDVLFISFVQGDLYATKLALKK